MSDRARTIVDPIVEEAIGWWVILHSGDATEAEHASATSWRQQDPRHMAAWQKVCDTMELRFAMTREVSGIPHGRHAVRQALLRPRRSRRSFLLKGSLAFAGLSTGGLALLHREVPITGLVADLRSHTGERTSYRLGEAGSLLLNARSYADTSTTRPDGHHQVQLREGELIAECNPRVPMPLHVASAFGTVSASTPGGRFMVQRAVDHDLVVSLRHDLQVKTPHGSAVLDEGQGLRLTATEFQRIEGDARDRAAWAQGLIVVHDESLSSVVAALQKYRRGLVRLSPEAARLRVLGVFPLDDTDSALDMLAQTLPLDIRRTGRLLTMIDAR